MTANQADTMHVITVLINSAKTHFQIVTKLCCIAKDVM